MSALTNICEGYINSQVPNTYSPEQKKEIQKAFFAGAGIMLLLPVILPEEEAKAVMADLSSKMRVLEINASGEVVREVQPSDLAETTDEQPAAGTTIH